MFLLKFRHVHPDETLNKKRQNLVIRPFMRSQSFQIRVYSLTDLLNVFMHVSRHLLGQLRFTCKTTVKHLLASMQLISSNNKSTNAKNITAVTWQTEFDEDASGFDSLWRDRSIRCWSLSVAVVVETGWLLPVRERDHFMPRVYFAGVSWHVCPSSLPPFILLSG